jgi:hypothetical protein
MHSSLTAASSFESARPTPMRSGAHSECCAATLRTSTSTTSRAAHIRGAPRPYGLGPLQAPLSELVGVPMVNRLRRSRSAHTSVVCDKLGREVHGVRIGQEQVRKGAVALVKSEQISGPRP